MTPMLDIVFILLIFFIVTATFLRETGIDMRSPPPSEDPPTESSPLIIIQLDDRDNVFVNRRLTDINRVGPSIERLRADNPDSAVMVQPDSEATHGAVVSVFDQARQIGVPVTINRDGDGT